MDKDNPCLINTYQEIKIVFSLYRILSTINNKTLHKIQYLQYIKPIEIEEN